MRKRKTHHATSIGCLEFKNVQWTDHLSNCCLAFCHLTTFSSLTILHFAIHIFVFVCFHISCALSFLHGLCRFLVAVALLLYAAFFTFSLRLLELLYMTQRPKTILALFCIFHGFIICIYDICEQGH
jgi:hypothetical protein